MEVLQGVKAMLKGTNHKVGVAFMPTDWNVYRSQW
jgi:hypothetical protein